MVAPVPAQKMSKNVVFTNEVLHFSEVNKIYSYTFVIVFLYLHQISHIQFT